jgi:hypothetical protein
MWSTRLTVALCTYAVTGCGLVGYDVQALSIDANDDASADASDAGTMDASADASLVPLCPGGGCKAVFVSPQTPIAMLGNVQTADARCQSVAAANRLGGTFLAWISDDSSSPSSRFSRATVPYALLSGTLVANDYTDLTDGSLAHPIDVDVTGATLTGAAEVWTGTNPDGTSAGDSCAGWTNTSALTPFAVVGVTSNGGSAWTSIYLQFCDRTASRLYCFEQ